MLTKVEIRRLIELTQERIVVEPRPDFPFKVTERGRGYSGDPLLCRIQMKLSAMLEAAKEG